MNTFTFAEKLREYRPLLLACEAIGWFHMAGKAKIEFLRKQGRIQSYEEKLWHKEETPPFSWDDLLGWLKLRFSSIPEPEQVWPSTFDLFTERHADGDCGLLGLLQAAHGIVSGVEKNLPKSTSVYLNQDITHMWLSSPWGHPKRHLLANPPEILTPHGWRQLVAEIRRVLEEAQSLGTQSSSNVCDWQRWRDAAIGPKSFIRRAFLSTLAETRLPTNDVTLWDQSYVAAVLFKSAVAGAILEETNFPWKWQDIAQRLGIDLRTRRGRERNLEELSKEVRRSILNFLKTYTNWRLLTISIGTDHYEARAVKIGDWTGTQQVIEQFFSNVARLIEVDLAVGSLLYRDSSVVVFSFPGERSDESSTPASWIEGWEEWLQQEVDTLAKNLDMETPPMVKLSEPTRSLVPLVKERKKALNTLVVPVHRKWNIRCEVSDEARGNVCPVCQVRLNGDPTNKNKPCQVCRERRHHRLDSWLSGEFGQDTIWLAEVADSNDRVALVTFSLDIEPWLAGVRVDSLRAQAIPDWRRFNPNLAGHPNPIDFANSYETLKNEIKNRLPSYNSGDYLLQSLQAGYKNAGEWPLFFFNIVEDRADAPKWESLNNDKRAAWLAHQLFRKLPSPGRLYRFWRQTEFFFQDILREMREIASRDENRWRTRRLVIKPDMDDDHHERWNDRLLYNGIYNGAPVSLIYLRELEGFITACNLARLLEPTDKKSSLKEQTQNQEIFLRAEDHFKDVIPLKIKRIEEPRRIHAHLAVYHPVIPLELSPLRFRVLVPLNVASDCVDYVISRWQEEFARVWERLPLRIGVVAFSRKLPFRAVIEATRNLEEDLLKKEEIWCVEDKEVREGIVALNFQRPDGQVTLRTVPITMPDGRFDAFYPYMAVEDRDVRYPYDFQHPEGQVYRHAKDLGHGDRVKVCPACVATVFLDSSYRRFEKFTPRYLEDWLKMREVWQLLERAAPSQTALRGLQAELIKLQVQWHTPNGTNVPADLWEDTIRSLIARHLEVQGTVLEILTKAGANGLLQWAMEWHIAVLKQKV
jgi:hypothetical protein